MEGSYARTTLAVIGLVIAAAIVAVIGLRHTSSLEADLSSVAANLVEAERRAAHSADQLQRVTSELRSEQRLRASAEQIATEAQRKAAEAEKNVAENLTLSEKLTRDLEAAVAERDSLRERLGKLEPPAAPVLPQVPAAPPRAVWFASLQELWDKGHPEAESPSQFTEKLGKPFAELEWELWRSQPSGGGGHARVISWQGSWTETTWKEVLFPRFKEPSRLWWPDTLRLLRDALHEEESYKWRVPSDQRFGTAFNRLHVFLWELDADRTVVAMQPIYRSAKEDDVLPIVVLTTIPRDQFPVLAPK
jgi:hypothetical protein